MHCAARLAARAHPRRRSRPHHWSGPHLTDLAVRHTGKRADARDCSTGEQKALLISIMLADARELARARDGMAPLLLLDEIAAHLDAMRRAALFEEILALGAQAWMTGTDLSLFEAARCADLRGARTACSMPQGDAHDPAAQLSALLRALCRRHRGAGSRHHRHRGARSGHRLPRHHSRRRWASWWAI